MLQFIFFSSVILFYSCVSSSFIPEKKNDMGEFTSALNGAGRLRYGKRSDDNVLDSMPDSEDTTSDDQAASYFYYPKRSPMTNKLIASLNGAERLRFGKK